jgi:hypothetical protein
MMLGKPYYPFFITHAGRFGLTYKESEDSGDKHTLVEIERVDSHKSNVHGLWIAEKVTPSSPVLNSKFVRRVIILSLGTIPTVGLMARK